MATASVVSAPGAVANTEGGSEVGAAALLEPCLHLERLEESLREEYFAHDTEDREDHTFNGIMMDLTCRADLPCEYIEVQSVWVRGELGPLTVYAVDGGHLPHYDKPHVWTVHYRGTHDPSFNNLVKLQLDPPKRIEAGGRVGFYVHSTLPGDQSIVYDNTRHRYAPEEEDEEEGGGSQPVLQISPGVAHLSHVPFGGRAPWGSLPWRRSREFVGRIGYGVRWLCWTPDLHRRFPTPFKETVRTLLMCASRPESNFYHLRDEMIFFILNRCGWDWFGRDKPSTAPARPEEDEGRRQGRCTGLRGMGQEATVLELLGTFGNQLMLPHGWLEHFQFGQMAGDESEDEESEDGDYVPHLDDLNSEEEEEEEDDDDGSSEGDEGEGDGDNAPGTASAAADN